VELLAPLVQPEHGGVRVKAETVSIDSLSFDPANVRKHGERNLATIKASLQRFGQQKPIVVDANGVVRAGNGTLAAAKALGWKEIAVVRSTLAGSEATAYAIADNRTAELAEWDEDALAETLSALQCEDEALLDAAGFDSAELSKMIDGMAEVTEDEVTEPPAEPITKPGDLWLLGDHRVLCGDSSDPRDYLKLMSEETHQLTVLDPPYEMSESVWSRWIDDPSIVFGQMRQMRIIPAKLWRFERVIVKRYRHRSATVQVDHRHAFVAQVGSVKVLPGTSETFPSVIEQESDTEHDHQKPLATMLEHMTKWCPPWTLVRDPFLGSGTTLIAAEQLGRKCYGMEISPAYCDVIVKRWETLTGRKAELAKA